MRELTKNEIKEFEKRIEELRYKDEYRCFFTEEESKFDRVFDLKGYYATVSIYKDVPCLGIIKLGDNGSLTGVIQIFRKLIKEYKFVVIWRYKENIKLERLHNKIKNKFKFSKEIKEENKIIIIVGGEENGRKQPLKRNRQRNR